MPTKTHFTALVILLMLAACHSRADTFFEGGPNEFGDGALTCAGPCPRLAPSAHK